MLGFDFILEIPRKELQIYPRQSGKVTINNLALCRGQQWKQWHTMTMASVASADALEVTPLSILPFFLTLISLIQRHCLSVNSNQTDLVAACNGLGSSVLEFRKFLSPFQGILPTADDLTNYNSLPWQLRTEHNDTKVAEYLSQMFLDSFGEKPTVLNGDQTHKLLFSKASLDNLKRKLLKKEVSTFNLNQIAELNMNSLIQIRWTWLEMQSLKWYAVLLLAAAIIPSWVLLSCVLFQFLSLKRQQIKARRRTEQMTRDRMLLERLTSRRHDAAAPIAL